jgi:aspartate 1-decarboxylase
MQTIMLKSKLHKARVTLVELDYEGSCAIDGDLLEIAGSGMISVNGAAAHKATVGDTVIICAYSNYNEAELVNFKPRLIYLNEDNSISHTSKVIPTQAA